MSAPVMNELLSDPFASELETLAQTKTEAYKTNTPYPHAYFDDFLPVDVAEAALRDFPEPKEAAWQAYADVNQHKKLAFDVVEKLPASIRDVLYFLNSRPMLKFLETLTGIESVLPDPYYTGGGLHQIRPGGLLEVHADFSYHKKLRLDRRINVLIYLNKDWKEEYGAILNCGTVTLLKLSRRYCRSSIVARSSVRLIFSPARNS
jgi:hypothetical protein